MKVPFYPRRTAGHNRQQGYVLIVMMLFFVLLAISLTAVAPALSQSIRREREIELIHRGKQYVRAIRLFYIKFGRYPVRLEELENTNNVRFLRKRFKDPMMPGGDWRLIHYGEAQLTLPPGAPLLPGATVPGAPIAGAGAAPGVAGPSSSGSSFASTFSLSSPTAGQSGSTPGQTGTTATPSASSQSSQASQSSETSGQPGQSSGQPGTPVSQLSSSIGNGPVLGGGPIVGVSSKSKKESIKQLNKKNHYNDWEFVYDPSLDLTMAQSLAGVAGQQGSLAPGLQAPGAQSTFGPTTSPGMQQPASTGR